MCVLKNLMQPYLELLVSLQPSKFGLHSPLLGVAIGKFYFKDLFLLLVSYQLFAYQVAPLAPGSEAAARLGPMEMETKEVH